MEEELQRLWQLLAELSSQLTQNREQTEQLKKQAEELKTQAIHTGTGYALKRFNVDLSKEQFQSELERMNAQLVIENQTLQHENRNLTILLKDHETTLEQIMTRFRNHAHSTQQHELELTKYYESVILSVLEKQNTEHDGITTTTTNAGQPHDGQHENGAGPPAAELDPHTFQVIQNLSILIQKAMRELAGEEPYLNEIDELESLQQQQLGIQAEASSQKDEHSHPAGIAFQDPFDSVSPTSQAAVGGEGVTNRTSEAAAAAAAGSPRGGQSAALLTEYKPRVKDPSCGGYVGKRSGSLSDYALMNAIETERLRRENEHLREMLGIAVDCSNPLLPPPTPNLSPTPENDDDDDTTKMTRETHHQQLPALIPLDPHSPINNVVSDVIKEEEEEEEEEEEGDADEEDVQLDLAVQDPHWNHPDPSHPVPAHPDTDPPEPTPS